MNKNLTEKEIDDLAAAQAEDAWTIDYLKERAKRGSREKFLRTLSKVPKLEPDEEDRIE
ncbi:MAG TPA: hypothetical protein VK892_20685 [Pyrinomonadaceae bacterium]|nr:hypothetical protein [Pyrinomonadaceae bacterium]